MGLRIQVYKFLYVPLDHQKKCKIFAFFAVIIEFAILPMKVLKPILFEKNLLRKTGATLASVLMDGNNSTCMQIDGQDAGNKKVFVLEQRNTAMDNTQGGTYR